MFYGATPKADEYADTFEYSGPLWVLERQIGSLDLGTRYYFKVRAMNGCAPSEYSNVSTTELLSLPMIEVPEEFRRSVAEHASGVPVVEKIIDKKLEIIESELLEKHSYSSYIVEKGDSLWSISEKLLGDGTRYTELVNENISKYPSILKNLQPGMELILKQNTAPQEKEENIARLEHLDKALEYYREYAQEIARLPIIEVDTTDKSVEDTVQEILSKVEAYEQSDNR